MASNGELNDLLGQIPLGDLAKRFGVDETTIESAVKQALPGLVGGMAVNASESAGAQKLERAVQQHQPASGKLDLNAIDEEDGKKIVGHVLGDKEKDVAHALGAKAESSVISDLIPQLLPLLAPLVMQFLASRLGGAPQGTVAAGGSGDTGSASSGGGIGDVLGGLLGGLLGGGSKPATSGAGGGIGDMLGGLLGGLLGGRK